MSQLTVGQIIAALKQVPDDTPVFRCDSTRVSPLQDVEKIGFLVWPRTSGPGLVLGDTYFMKLELESFGFNMKQLAPDMDLPAPPKPSPAIKALEHTGWPFGVQTLMGKEPVDRDQFIREWESDDEYDGHGFGPVPEWATILDEEEEYAKMEDEDDEDD